MILFKERFYFIMCLFFVVLSLQSQNSPEDIVSEFTITDKLVSPIRLALDEQDYIYVSDKNSNTINVYNSNGVLNRGIPVTGKPGSLAIDSESTVYYGDLDTGMVFKMQNGKSSVFCADTKFPCDMVFGSDEHLYVTDSYLNQIMVIDKSGTVVKKIGTGLLHFPTGIAFDEKNQRIVVVEHGASAGNDEVTIFLFDLEGNVITQFGGSPSSWFGDSGLPGNTEFSRGQGVAVSRCGTIYIIDPFQATVSVFDENIGFKTRFGDYGSSDGQLDIPLDIVMNSQDQLILSCFNKGTIEVFSFNDILPTSNMKMDTIYICQGETAEIPINFTGVEPWTFTYSIDGIQQTPITTSETPYLLTSNISGLYEIAALSDANATGVCFTGNTQLTVNGIAPTATLLCDNPNICQGEEASIQVELTGVGPWAFEYTRDGESPIAVETLNTPYVIHATVPGLYEVSSLSGGGCSGNIINGPVAITVNTVPSARVLNNDKYIKAPSGTSVQIEIGFTGIPPFTFVYAKDGLNELAVTTTDNPCTLIMDQEGTYEINSVEDALCLNANWQDFFDFSYRDPKLPTATFKEPYLEVCQGNSIDIPIYFTEESPWQFTYVRDGQYPTQITTEESPYYLNVSEEGTYEIIALSDLVGDSENITGSTYVKVLSPPITDYFYEVTKLNVQFINGSFEADSYFWDFGDGNTSIEENPYHTFSQDGIYVVRLTAYNSNCNAVYMEKEIQVGEDILSVGIHKNYDKYTIMIYPNPSYGEFSLKISPKQPLLSNINVIIQSTHGRIVFNKNYDLGYVTYYNGSYYLNFSLSNFDKGIYLLTILADNYNETEKLVLKD